MAKPEIVSIGRDTPRCKRPKAVKQKPAKHKKNWERKAHNHLASANAKRHGVRRSNIINNPRMKHSGAGVIWNEV